MNKSTSVDVCFSPDAQYVISGMDADEIKVMSNLWNLGSD